MSISNHIWTSEPMRHIWPRDVYFPVFHSSLFILLPFLHSSNKSFPRCLLPMCQNKSKCETIHMTSTYGFRTKTRCEPKTQGNIHPWAASQGPLILSVEGCRSTAECSCSFIEFLASERFYCNFDEVSMFNLHLLKVFSFQWPLQASLLPLKAMVLCTSRARDFWPKT